MAVSDAPLRSPAGSRGCCAVSGSPSRIVGDRPIGLPSAATSRSATRIRSLAACVLLLASLTACGRGSAPASSGPPKQPEPARALPADFVICVDNSASISPAEQGLILETLMLLADLAAVGDRLAFVRFGEGAEVGMPIEIATDADRGRIKEHIRTTLDFKQRFSDLRAAVRAVSDNQARLFRPVGTSVRVPIIVSDGKLEPADRNASGALDELRGLIRGPLAQVGFHAIVTGNTRCNDEIVAGVTGRALMEQEIARIPDRFFHAASFDQLLDAAVLVLTRAKGMSARADQQKAQFKIDSTVEAFTAIVRKRSLAGEVLCKAEDIRLIHRAGSGAPATVLTFATYATVLPGSVYWTDDYQHFDLIVVRKPRQGMWSVELASGRPAQVLGKIDTPVELRVNARPSYYANESAFMTAAVYDRNANSALRQPFRIDAFLSGQGPSVPFQASTSDGSFYLEVPEAIRRALPAGERPATIELDVVAQMRTSPGSSELDPWFVRRSYVRMQIAEPLTRWGLLPERSVLVFGAPVIEARVAVDFAKPNAPVFESTPRMTITIERWDEKAQAYAAATPQELAPLPSGKQVTYAAAITFAEAGTYRYSYRLGGNTTAEGPFVMVSPAFTMRIVSLRLYVVLGVTLLLLAGLAWASARGARLTGRIGVREQRRKDGFVNLRGLKTYVSGRDMDGIAMGAVQFALRPRRLLFVFSRQVVFTLNTGTAKVGGIVVPAGGTRRLRVGQRHRVVFVREGGVEVELTLNISV